MSRPMSSRGNQGDQHARPVGTVKGVWGLAPSRGVGAEPPQDTVALELAEERA